MAEAKKEVAKKEAPAVKTAEVSTKRVAAQVAIGAFHKVKNISEKLINTSKEGIKPGETGLASTAECNQLSKWLKKLDG